MTGYRRNSIAAGSLWFAILFLTACVGIGHSLAAEKCAYPNSFDALLTATEKRIGTFRITLQPPDYGSISSIRQHLIFSRTWAELLNSRLQIYSHSTCRASIFPAIFPDMVAFLAVDRSTGIAEEDRSLCRRELQQVLAESRPDTKSIKTSAQLAEILFGATYSGSTGIEFNETAVLMGALAQIYKAGTVMHTLISVGGRDFESIDPNALVDWIGRQRSAKGFGLTEIPACPSDIGPQTSFNADANVLPYSATIPAGSLTLSMNSHGESLPPALRHVVIVGQNSAATSVAGLDTPVSVSALTKFCGRRFAVGSNVDATVRVRCSTQIHYSKNWVIFFCDPNDCRTTTLAERVARMIATDTDVTKLAAENIENGATKGPYLVRVDLVPRHSGYDWLIPSQFRIGRSFGATRIWMLLVTPG
jgi:hypothetical protein